MLQKNTLPTGRGPAMSSFCTILEEAQPSRSSGEEWMYVTSTPDQCLPGKFNILSLYLDYSVFSQMLNHRLMLCIILCLFALNSNTFVHTFNTPSIKVCDVQKCCFAIIPIVLPLGRRRPQTSRFKMRIQEVWNMQSDSQRLEQQPQQGLREREQEQEQHEHEEDGQRERQEMQLCERGKGEGSAARTSADISGHAQVGVTFAGRASDANQHRVLSPTHRM